MGVAWCQGDLGRGKQEPPQAQSDSADVVQVRMNPGPAAVGLLLSLLVCLSKLWALQRLQDGPRSGLHSGSLETSRVSFCVIIVSKGPLRSLSILLGSVPYSHLVEFI